MTSFIVMFSIGLLIGITIALLARALYLREKAQNELALWEMYHAGDIVTPHTIQKVDEFAAMRRSAQPSPTGQQARVFVDTYAVRATPTYFGVFADTYYADGGLTYDPETGTRSVYK